MHSGLRNTSAIAAMCCIIAISTQEVPGPLQRLVNATVFLQYNGNTSTLDNNDWSTFDEKKGSYFYFMRLSYDRCPILFLNL